MILLNSFRDYLTFVFILLDCVIFFFFGNFGPLSPICTSSCRWRIVDNFSLSRKN